LPEITQKYIARTTQDFWAAIIEALEHWSNIGPDTAFSITAVDDELGPAIEFFRQVFDDPNEYRWLAVWDKLTWNDPLPQRPWATMQGASGELQNPFGGALSNTITWDEMWDLLGAAIQDWMLVALDPVSVDVIDTRIVLDGLIQLQLGTFVFLIDAETTKPTYLVWSYQTSNTDDGPLSGVKLAGNGALSPAIGPIVNSQMIGPGLQQIADAIQEISDQDVETSINQNAYVYSIKSKVLTSE